MRNSHSSTAVSFSFCNHHLYCSSFFFASSTFSLAVHHSLDFTSIFLSWTITTSPLATIDSTIHPGLTRDVLSSQTQSDPALASVASRPASTSTHPLPQRVPTDSAVPSLVPAIRSRSELEQEISELDDLSSLAPPGLYPVSMLYYYFFIWQSPLRQTPPIQELVRDQGPGPVVPLRPSLLYRQPSILTNPEAYHLKIWWSSLTLILFYLCLPHPIYPYMPVRPH